MLDEWFVIIRPLDKGCYNMCVTAPSRHMAIKAAVAKCRRVYKARFVFAVTVSNTLYYDDPEVSVFWEKVKKSPGQKGYSSHWINPNAG